MEDLPSVFLCAHPHLAIRDEFLLHLCMLEAQWLDLQDYIAIETSMGSSMPSVLEYSCLHTDPQFESRFLSPGPIPVRITLPEANPAPATLAGEAASALSLLFPFLVTLAASNTPVHTLPELIHQIFTMEDILVATFNSLEARYKHVFDHACTAIKESLTQDIESSVHDAVEEEAIDLKAELHSSIRHDRIALLTLIHDGWCLFQTLNLALPSPAFPVFSPNPSTNMSTSKMSSLPS
ncbi:uncharacterized protein LAESUDRAFT_755847 [Laetiporus sulphureus 93-53]|uniref:Uncharacterized protein n=1 Tax=Laetiporus sulphureus 93-53 TaxID=1314785 RepID=A0A165GH47_9APHY|nr:uncharacterized protein LAESUDRAFT_755847 [Laetiporus sulphureus 93-53]KZT10339.1 hypothetical protein LAESUDRAFT_755847 [Laetiporus sulphureus 93-53]